MSEILDCFTVPIYQTKLDLNNKSIYNYCLSLQKKDKGRTLSNMGGWQSSNLNGKHMPLNEMFEDIEHHLNIFVKKLHFNKSVRIGNIWININGFKDFNITHTHPNSVLSGVYYVNTPEKCGNICFEHPALDNMLGYYSNDNIEKYEKYNSSSYFYNSIAGKMYIFPSWLRHFVQPNLNKKEKRVSISFNCQFI